MTKKSIAVDLDSTLNNLEQVWILQRYNEMYNDSLTADDMRCWNVHEYVKPECSTKVYDILMEPNLFRYLGVKDEHTIKVMKDLCFRFDVYIVSSCHPATVADKVAWVEEHLPFFDSRNFVACHPKHIINTDFLIDDGPHNIEAFKQQGIIIDAAYNRHLTDPKYVRCNGWKEVANYFKTVE